MMEVSPSMSDIFYHQQQQQARMASAYLEHMTFPFGYPQYPMYPSYREDDYGRRRAVVVPPPARFDPMSVDFPMEARPRSGSLGSTGSSLRDGHSPSFDSMTGGSGGSSVGDSVSSRDSPFSFTSSSPSPSPLSPPTPAPASDGGSKLRRVLMGTLSSPYSVLFRRVCPSPRDAVVDTNSVTPRKRKYDSMQTTPMDLSCKRPGTPAIPCSSHNVGPRNTSTPPSTEDAGHPSILKAILCGRHADADRRISSGAAAAIDATSTTTTATHSAMTPTGRPSPCPAAIANSCSTAASTALPVTLAKKNLLPVSARVLDWLLRTVRFARALPQFANLSHHDKVALLLNSWPRVLLLYMAETDFEFAVTTVPSGLTGGGDTRSPVPPTTVEGASGDSEVPTMNSVEGIQRFIRKCQALNLDSTEYEYMRIATLFHRGFLGVEDAGYVDSVNTYVRRALREHIATRYPSEKLRYSSILLCLPGLFAINGRVVEALFCRQVVSDCDDTESMLKELLTRDSSGARAH